MSNWKQLQQQQNQGSDYAKMNYVMRLEAKSNNEIKTTTDGDEFVKRTPYLIYGKDEQRIELQSITGYFVGSFFIKEAYDQANKIGYKSSPYFNKQNNISIWRGSQKEDFKGNVIDSVEYIEKCGVKPKTKICLVILTEKGLVVIKSNTSLAIDNIKALGKETMENYMVKLTAKLFDSKEWRKGLPEEYKVLTKDKQPCYAEITKDAYIDGEIEELLGKENLFNAISDFAKYKESICSFVHSDTTPIVASRVNSVSISMPAPKIEAPALPDIDINSEDDLPF